MKIGKLCFCCDVLFWIEFTSFFRIRFLIVGGFLFHLFTEKQSKNKMFLFLFCFLWDVCCNVITFSYITLDNSFLQNSCSWVHKNFKCTFLQLLYRCTWFKNPGDVFLQYSEQRVHDMKNSKGDPYYCFFLHIY